jgi:PAS domain S-box-containing protein
MGLVEKITVYFRSSLSRKFMLSIVVVNALLVGAVGWELYYRVGISRSGVVALDLQSILSAIALGAAIVFLGGLVAYLTGRSITERLANLAQVADRFRLGERGARLSDHGHDEVATTARGLNAMLAAVAESERSLKEVCRIAQIGSWRYDPADRRLEMSQTLEEILGLGASEGLPVEEVERFVTPRQRRRLAGLLESGDSRRFSFTFKFKANDGPSKTLWVEARVESPPGTVNPILLGICQDITDRESKDAQLRQAQKMEVVGQLTGGLAHDFNNLLAIIVGNLDLLQDDFTSGTNTPELVDEALAAALRGAELTRQLLAFSRRQPLSPQRVDLNRLVTEMASLWRRTLTEAIEVRIHLADEVWPTRVDASQLESAILNLVVNARDAMPDGGVLTIEIANMSIAAGDWYDGEESDIEPGDYAVISVSDNGSGMPPHVAARVFEPFFTTKPLGQGTGLGLSMIYGFAKQSGGSVKIYSEADEGTTVRLYLPRYRAKDGKAPEVVALDPIASVGNERILLVEDNDAVRRVVARQLEELGYSVVTACNAAEALQVLEGDKGIELLFTDVVMPGGMNGFELGRQAQKRRPALKVLHTTGFTRPVDDVSGTKGPPPHLLTKPYRKANLAIKLRQVIDGSVGD